MNFRLFVPITKVDQAQRMVYGTAVAEQLDRAGEIFDYASSKPHFQKWSEEIEKITDGKSLGNVRAMHGKTAAGKLTAIDFDDPGKKIDVAAKIVDDNEWNKVEEGVYTGFSIGGSYVKRWNDSVIPTAKRYTANPVEVSIVDLACVPGATFNMIKASGLTEVLRFKGPQPRQVWQAGITGPLFDGKAACAKYLARDVSKDAIAAKALVDEITKGLGTVSWLADLLQQLDFIRDSVKWEADYEGDGSTLPAQLRSAMETLTGILRSMVTEETSELLAAADKTAPAPLAKSQAEKIQGIHDHAAAMGAKCGSEKSVAAADLQKGDDMTKEEIATLTKDVGAAIGGDLTKGMEAGLAKVTETLTKSVNDGLAKVSGEIKATDEKLSKSLGEIDARVKVIEAQPAAGKGAVKVVPLDRKSNV